MPKLAPRCNRRGRYGNNSLLSVPPVAFLAPPRKVSFEDGHQDAASSTTTLATEDGPSSSHQHLCSDRRGSGGFCALAMPVLQEQASPRPLSGLRRKSGLIRPTTSQCLVELAKSSDDDSDSADDDQIHHSRRKRCRVVSRTTTPSPTNVSELAAPVSPVPQDPSSSGVTTPPNSPWGHFVDIVIPNEGQQVRTHCGSSQSSSHVYHDGRCNCCTSCRRRRVGPYGGVYNKKNTSSSSSSSSSERRPLCFLQSDDNGPLFPTMNSSGIRATFKLLPSPRKEYQPTEQLVSALHQMRVD